MALRPPLFVGLLVMLAAIGGAWGFQLIGGYVPCALCLEQRVPYYVAIPLAALAFAVGGASLGLTRTLAIAAGVAMVVALALGIYHAGAEWALWPGPDSCGGGGDVRDAGNLLSAMDEMRLVSCTEATGRFLGLSFAGWQAIAAAMAAGPLLAAGLGGRR